MRSYHRFVLLWAILILLGLLPTLALMAKIGGHELRRLIPGVICVTATTHHWCF